MPSLRSRELTPEPEPQPQLLPTALASSLAALLARFPLHPLDTCKAKLQVQLSTPARRELLPSARVVLRQTLAREGIAGLYRGFAITAIGSIPAGSLYFSSYEWFKHRLLHYGAVGQFLAGFGAETVSCLIWVPIDVVKERLQVQSSISNPRHRYAGTIDALRTILRTEGFRGIYKGYGATLLSFGPFSAFYLMIYEQLKSCAQNYYGQAEGVGTSTFMASGAIAGAAASFITCPLDMAKLRMQVQRSGLAFDFKYRNFGHALRTIVREEGARALFKGVVARMSFHAPATALTITLFESFKKMFTERIHR